MGYLFDIPILPFYNKGKKNSLLVVYIFIYFCTYGRLRRPQGANLEKGQKR